MTGLLPTLGLALLAIGAGVSVVVQQALNVELRTSIGSPLWAAFVSYGIGALAIAAALMAMHEPWPVAAAMQASAPMSWLGGLFGTVYIVVSIC